MIRRSAFCGILTLALAVLSVTVPTAQANRPFVLSLFLDGGYSYAISKNSNALTVGAFADPNDKHQDHDRMMLTLLVGQAQGGTQKRRDLAGMDLRIVTPPNPNHANSAKLGLPQLTQPGDPCQKAEFTNDANNLFFFPDIPTLGNSGFVGPLHGYKSRLLLKAGRIAALRTVACWDWKDGAATPNPPKQAFIAGLGGVKYNMEFLGNELELQLTPKGTQAPVTSLKFSPVMMGNSYPEIMLTINRDKDNPSPWIFGAGWAAPGAQSTMRQGSHTGVTATGAKLDDFERFYRLLLAPFKPPMPYKAAIARESAITPGDECPPALYFVQ